MSERCPYCKRWYAVTPGKNRLKCCSNEKCLEKHREAQKAVQRPKIAARHRMYRSPSYKLENKKKLESSGMKVIFCIGCHKWKQSIFEPYCAECRERRRDLIDTEFMFLADNVHVWGK